MNNSTDTLPCWSVADVHESFESRTFVDAMDRVSADTAQLTALFDQYAALRRVRSPPTTARPPTK
jgi:hypothetical protein